jgi:hypothetical protein
MKYLNYNLQNLYLTNKKLFGRLKNSCYRDGFIKTILVCYKDKFKDYNVHILFDENYNILSWILAYDISPGNKHISLWTPYKSRKKGYMRILLNELAKDFNSSGISVYDAAEKVIKKVYGDSHNIIYSSNCLPHEL